MNEWMNEWSHFGISCKHWNITLKYVIVHICGTSNQPKAFFFLLVTVKQAFPAVTDCEPGATNLCFLKRNMTNDRALLNCTLHGVYPEAELRWSLAECDASSPRPSFSTTSRVVFDQDAETFDECEELEVQVNTSVTCCYQCVASGVAIPACPIITTVVVIGKH